MNRNGRVLCFYHRADLDGKCAAAIVRRRYPGAVLVGVDYTDDFSSHLERVQADDSVVMVDVAFANGDNFDAMLDLQIRCADLTWIDHHKTALDLAEKHRFHPAGSRRVGSSGCELAWEHFFPGESMPRAVYLLGRYDVWDQSRRDDWLLYILPFQYGMRATPNSPDSAFWKSLFREDGTHDESDRIRQCGASILRYVFETNTARAKACAFETQLSYCDKPNSEPRHLRAIAINAAMANSQMFDSVWDPERYDVMLPFAWYQHVWKCSLYSTKPDVDCGAVAKVFGGGGHKGAAGFECAELPFDLAGAD